MAELPSPEIDRVGSTMSLGPDFIATVSEWAVGLSHWTYMLLSKMNGVEKLRQMLLQEPPETYWQHEAELQDEIKVLRETANLLNEFVWKQRPEASENMPRDAWRIIIRRMDR